MSDLVDWIMRLFGDCRARAPFGIGLELDSAEPPLVAFITPADMPTGRVRLDRDDLRGRIDFASRVQALLDVALDQPVPRCPAHELGLTPTRIGDDLKWACPDGDFQCAIGEYELSAYWPPTEADGFAAPLLSQRFDRLGVTGLSSFWVENRDGQLVARIAVWPDADEDAVRAAASPLLVEFSHVPAISTVREWHRATDCEPAHEVLTVTNVAMRLARLDGLLHRAVPGDACDFRVGDARVRLGAAHVIGGPGDALLLDADRVPFADEGDRVSCAGGCLPSGPVRGQDAIFSAGRIAVYRDEPRGPGQPEDAGGPTYR